MCSMTSFPCAARAGLAEDRAPSGGIGEVSKGKTSYGGNCAGAWFHPSQIT